MDSDAGPDVSDFSDTGLTEDKMKNVESEGATASAAAEPQSANTVGSFLGELSPKSRRGPRSSGGQSSASRGTQKGDDDRAQKQMLCDLELLEEGHVKVRLVFPAVVLGHLFMRKYGLSREQRSLVIRATGGSSRFDDVERIMRANDFEDRRPDGTGSGRPCGCRPRIEAVEANV